MVSYNKRIVLYRIGAIGDIIHTLPFIKLIKELNPKACIEYIIGSDQVKALLDKYAIYIDKVHYVKHKSIFDKPAQLFIPQEDKELIARLQESPVDEFIYLHSNKLKAEFLNRRVIKAKNLYVYKRNESLSAHANYVTCRYPDLKEELLENPFNVLKHHTLQEFKGDTEKKNHICIVPGVGKLRPSRAYPLLSWVRLIEDLLAKTDYQVNILGGPDEKELSLELDKLIEHRRANLNYGFYERAPDFSRLFNMIGKTSLLEMATLLKQSSQLYSADTGTLHIAAALDVPITSVFSITSERRFGPFHPQAKIFRSNNCSCSQSFTNLPKHCQNQCAGYAKCMFDIDLSASI